jgi:hypothetical protein
MFCEKIEECLQNLYNPPDPIVVFRKMNGAPSGVPS